MARPRPGFALAVGAVFLGLLLFNLCIPEPRGPADNGAFAALGEGPVEMVKLLYFANLLFDVHLLLGLCGLASSLGWIRIPEGLPNGGLAGRVEGVP